MITFCWVHDRIDRNAAGDTGGVQLCVTGRTILSCTPFRSIVGLFGCICGLLGMLAGGSSAAILGTNSPAAPLTAGRISALPKTERAQWQEYLDRSLRQRIADQTFLKNELQQHGLKQTILPPAGTGRGIPLDRSDAWYGQPEALRIADVILSFQTPAGGWNKNLDMTGRLRSPGMHFAADNTSHVPSAGDFDAPTDVTWNYVGTFDNDGTIVQLRFLARVIGSLTLATSQNYKASVTRGLDYIHAAQYPNGGWPQVWPLAGGYHDAVTLNDNSMRNILALLRDVSLGTNGFSFVSQSTRRQAAQSFQRGLQCVLSAQVKVDGQRTAWAQQYDVLTLAPTSARNYEMPSLSAGESAAITLFLMELPEPNLDAVRAVRAAAKWFEKTQIRDVAFKEAGSEGRQLVSSQGSGPIWARYYEIGTDRPLFGDRDKTIHDDVNEISKERRMGYSWYAEFGTQVLQEYSRWSPRHPLVVK